MTIPPPPALHELVAMLGDVRKELDEAERACQWILDAARLSDEYRAAAERAERAKARLEDLESAVKNGALSVYMTSGDKKPAPGVQVKLYTTLEYDYVAALDWARANLPAALSLDKRFFETHAKAVAGTLPVPCVNVVKVPRVTIARPGKTEPESE